LHKSSVDWEIMSLETLARLKKLFAAFILVAVLSLAGITYAKFQSNEIIIGLATPLAPSSESGVDFSILTYNLQSRPFLDDAGEKLPKISPLLNGYDIIAVQECFQKHELLWAQADFPNKAYFGDLSAYWKLANSGLSMMSRLPVADVQMHHYAHVGEFQNYVASKGIMLLSLNVNGLTLDVYNTHMEAGDTEAAHKARRGQEQEVIEFVSTHSPPEHSVILCGDFNMGPHRAGKAFKEYAPNHYSDEHDMEERTATFEQMREGLNLLDVHDVLLGRIDDGIERFLYREGTRHKLTPLYIFQNDNDFNRADGTPLSDGVPRIATFHIESR